MEESHPESTFLEGETEQVIRREESEDNVTGSESSVTEEPTRHQFKLESTKGCIIYDQRTKTKRYVSPFE